jgi:hypothetical protein
LLPTWGVGRFRADGNGGLFGVEVTVNLGGCVIVRQSGSGEYTVERNGTGSGELNLTNDIAEPVGGIDDPCPPLDAGLLEDSISTSFEFVISEDGFEFIGLDFKDAEGNPITAFGSRGFARPQE